MGASGFARKAIEYFDLTADDMKTGRDIVVGPPIKFKRRPGATADSAGAGPASPSRSPSSTTSSPSTAPAPALPAQVAPSAPAPALSPSGAASAPAPALSPSGAASAPASANYPSAAERAATPVSASASDAAMAPEKSSKSSTFGQWAALFAGVMIQPFFQAYQATHKWAFDGLGGWAFFALITSVLIFPAVYRNAFDKDKPVVLQLAPIFAAGLGWQSLLTTAIKAAGH